MPSGRSRVHVARTLAARRYYTPPSLPHTGDLIAFDPSIRAAGVAHFCAGHLKSAARFVISDPTIECPACDGKSKSCARCEGKGKVTADDATRALRMAQQIATWVLSKSIVPRMFATEWPQAYGVGRSECDPNGLMPMVAVIGNLTALLFQIAAQSNRGFEAVSYKPAEWKQGSRDKKAIAADINTRLSRDERALLPNTLTDEWDACGVGLYHLGRFAPVRVTPGAAKPSSIADIVKGLPV